MWRPERLLPYVSWAKVVVGRGRKVNDLGRESVSGNRWRERSRLTTRQAVGRRCWGRQETWGKQI